MSVSSSEKRKSVKSCVATIIICFLFVTKKQNQENSYMY